MTDTDNGSRSELLPVKQNMGYMALASGPASGEFCVEPEEMVAILHLQSFEQQRPLTFSLSKRNAHT